MGVEGFGSEDDSDDRAGHYVDFGEICLACRTVDDEAIINAAANQAFKQGVQRFDWGGGAYEAFAIMEKAFFKRKHVLTTCAM